MWWIILIVALIIFVIATTIRIVPQTQALVIEFLGKYSRTLDAGINFTIPFIERVVARVNLKEQLGDFPPQPVITKDNVTMQIDTAVYFKVFDPKLYAYGVERPIESLAMLTATTLRNIVGSMDLDDTLTSRDEINGQMCVVLDDATDQWGIKVTRVEIKSIIPPRDIQDAMDKQMKAEREKRQTLLEAQAHKESAVTRAEGDKQAAILTAEAERDAAIARATGEAESIRLVYEAEARGLRMLAEAGVNNSVLVLKKIEALKELGYGQATKIVVPTELASLAADMTVKGELLDIADKASTTPTPQTPVKEDVCCNEPERSKVTAQLSKAERQDRLEQLKAEQKVRNEARGLIDNDDDDDCE